MARGRRPAARLRAACRDNRVPGHPAARHGDGRPGVAGGGLRAAPRRDRRSRRGPARHRVRLRDPAADRGERGQDGDRPATPGAPRRVGDRAAHRAGRRVRAAAVAARRAWRRLRARRQARAVASGPAQRRHRGGRALPDLVPVVAAPAHHARGVPDRSGGPVARTHFARPRSVRAPPAQSRRTGAAAGLGHHRARARRRRRAAPAPAQRGDRGRMVRHGRRPDRCDSGEQDHRHPRRWRGACEGLARRCHGGRCARPAGRRGTRGAVARGDGFPPVRRRRRGAEAPRGRRARRGCFRAGTRRASTG